MAESINDILRTSNVTATAIARQSNIDVAQVSQALKQPIATWSIQILNAIAAALDERPGELLDRIQDFPFELHINDEALTIQHVRFSDLAVFQQVRFAVESNVLEGWKPTAHEIQMLKKTAETPNHQILMEIDGLFGDQND